MWCEHCLTDVGAIVSGDGQTISCASCGQTVKRAYAPSLHPETRSAREFLERWAAEQRLQSGAPESGPAESAGLPVETPPSDNFRNQPTAPAVPDQTAAAEAVPPMAPNLAPPVQRQPLVAPEDEGPRTALPEKLVHRRLDADHGAPAGPLRKPLSGSRRPRNPERTSTAPENVSTSAAIDDNKVAEPPLNSQPTTPDPVPQKRRRTRIDAAAPTPAPAPHFDFESIPHHKRPGAAETMWGQLLAYAGVGLLTVGTSLVLWGYFGDAAQYASTGWLLSTAGQMLLLLGVVTLIGGGMQQTTHEVTQRIEHLGGRIIRIEESTDQILKGPHSRKGRRAARRAATARDGTQADAA